MKNVRNTTINARCTSGVGVDVGSDPPPPGELASHLRTFGAVLWSGPRRTALAFLSVAILGVIGLTVVGQLRLNSWFKDFYDAIEIRDLGAFWTQLLVFAVLVVALLILNVVQTWLNRMIKLRTRERLTRDLIAQWLVPRREFLLAGAGTIGRNPDQRIHEDANHLSELTADLAIGFVQAFFLLVSFIGVLWLLSGGVQFTIEAHTFSIPGYMVWCALIYAAVGSLLSWLVGRPLISLNAERYAREADLRVELVRTNENVDGIALYGGEAREETWLNAEVDRLLVIVRRIVDAITRLTWVTAGYGWFAIVIPIMAAAPGYFQGHLTFGDLMMVAGAFNQVQQSLRWFVDNFGAIADWQATLRRVIGLRQSLLKLDTLRPGTSCVTLTDSASGSIQLEDVVVALPTGRATLEPARLEILPGAHVLILGKPGVGKSYVFRAIAGLWSSGSGKISIPPGARLSFLPQRPYVPPGTLRSGLCAPIMSKPPEDAKVFATLARVGLARLCNSLDTFERWDKVLPIDDQHRLSFARLLLCEPDFVFVDETLDVLDEESRALITDIFDTELARAAVVVFSRNAAQEDGFKRLAQVVRTESQSVPGAASSEREPAPLSSTA